MSDQGEKTCPLCAEEMDLTDQQLKPCKCGYEICVWCWHHIMDMAEKDAGEGRCPACRTPYDKEKIVGTMANCERIVAEMNMEKKLKLKTKSKTSDSRKQLTSVRVVQRNLVYVMGLPLNLADEDLLQRKEYFSQYGKVLKVSMSRTSAGAIQQFPNSTCSVYITYSQVEEAVCCIHYVHGFVLDGKPLRACFGTTKYCHQWIRNVPCTNPDCLYLHEVGSQEDSFSKDEVMSGNTRNRVQQITGSTNCGLRRSGSHLPPPADDYYHCDSAWAGKPISQSPNISPAPVRESPPNSSSGRSTALPAGALWGTRPSNTQSPSASSPCPNGSLRAKPDKCSDSVESSIAVGKNTVLPSDPGKQIASGEESSNSNQDKSNTKTLLPSNQSSGVDYQASDTQMLCSDMSSLILDCHQTSHREALTSQIASKVAEKSDEIHITRDMSGSGDNSLSFYDQRPTNLEAITEIIHNLNSSDSVLSSTQSVGSVKTGMQIVGKFDSILPSSGIKGITDGQDNITDLGKTDKSYFPLPNVDQRKQGINFEGGVIGGSSNIVENMEESSIISNILSLDFDPWSEPLTSPKDFVKLLGDTDKQPPLSSLKLHNSNQSRFSFAREEEPTSQTIDLGPSLCYTEQIFNNLAGHNVSGSRGFQPDNLVARNGFSLVNEDSNSYGNSYLPLSNHKSSVSRSQMAGPPGFTATSRAPALAFMPHNMMENNFDSLPGTYTHETPMLRNQYQAPLAGNMVRNDLDIEFIDPAILAVCKGNVPSGPNGFPLQFTTSDNGGLQFLLQQSLSPLQNQRFPDIQDSLSAIGDAYRISPGVLEQTISNNLSPFSSVTVSESGTYGHWDAWNRTNGLNDFGVSELIQTERLGLNKLYTGYEDSKFGMTNPGNLYSRTYWF